MPETKCIFCDEYGDNCMCCPMSSLPESDNWEARQFAEKYSKMLPPDSIAADAIGE